MAWINVTTLRSLGGSDYEQKKGYINTSLIYRVEENGPNTLLLFAVASSSSPMKVLVKGDFQEITQRIENAELTRLSIGN